VSGGDETGHLKEAVDHPLVASRGGVAAGRADRVRVSFPFVTERIALGRFEQRRDARVTAVDAGRQVLAEVPQRFVPRETIAGREIEIGR
jgi:hypothetical protein